MLHRLALLMIIALLLVGCNSPTPIPPPMDNSPAPAASNGVIPTIQPTPTSSPTPPPTVTIAPTVTPTVEQAWRSYTNDAGGYTLDIPADWGVVGEPLSSVMFFEPEVDLDQLTNSEPQFFAGGVDILGFIADAPDPYEAVLPNHSAIVEMQPIETPLGAGRVYTLRRDRFQPTGSETVWYAQQAMIPIGSRIVSLWVQVDATTSGAPAPELARMLASLQLK
ncbi:MAG TPA: hypothetical protein VGD58_08080 [Herpetosiphonaceae bacterium]